MTKVPEWSQNLTQRLLAEAPASMAFWEIMALALANERRRYADELESLKAAEIRLAMGEMTAQEMRNIKAFIQWRVSKMRDVE